MSAYHAYPTARPCSHSSLCDSEAPHTIFHLYGNRSASFIIRERRRQLSTMKLWRRRIQGYSCHIEENGQRSLLTRSSHLHTASVFFSPVSPSICFCSPYNYLTLIGRNGRLQVRFLFPSRLSYCVAQFSVFNQYYILENTLFSVNTRSSELNLSFRAVLPSSAVEKPKTVSFFFSIVYFLFFPFFYRVKRYIVCVLREISVNVCNKKKSKKEKQTDTQTHTRKHKREREEERF